MPRLTLTALIGSAFPGVGGVLAAAPGGGLISVLDGGRRVARFNEDGTPDAAFSSNGVAELPDTIGGRDVTFVVALDADAGGRVFALVLTSLFANGTSEQGTQLVRLTRSGAFDPTFVPASQPGSGPAAVRVLDDGSVLTAVPVAQASSDPDGEVTLPATGTAIRLTRYATTGPVGPNDGVRAEAFLFGPAGERPVAVSRDGLTTGAVGEQVARFRPDGSADPNFNGGLPYSLPEPATRVGALAVAPSGRVFALASVGSDDPTVPRVSPGGQLEATGTVPDINSHDRFLAVDGEDGYLVANRLRFGGFKGLSTYSIATLFRAEESGAVTELPGAFGGELQQAGSRIADAVPRAAGGGLVFSGELRRTFGPRTANEPASPLARVRFTTSADARPTTPPLTGPGSAIALLTPAQGNPNAAYRVEAADFGPGVTLAPGVGLRAA